jgi:hypothetical protein
MDRMTAKARQPCQENEEYQAASGERYRPAQGEPVEAGGNVGQGDDEDKERQQQKTTG